MKKNDDKKIILEDLQKIDLPEELIQKILSLSKNKLFITEEKLKEILTENQISELIDQGILTNDIIK